MQSSIKNINSTLLINLSLFFIKTLLIHINSENFMIHRKDKKMRNKKKIKGLIKNILKNTLRVILSALISETNTAIDFNRLLKLILIEILFELLLYINSKD